MAAETRKTFAQAVGELFSLPAVDLPNGSRIHSANALQYPLRFPFRCRSADRLPGIFRQRKNCSQPISFHAEGHG